MLNEDNRTIFQILDDIKKTHQEWVKKAAEKKECNLCYDNLKCWWHKNPGE